MRGFDLANISFIKSDTGWIVFDPLTAKETAAAALKFINEQLGERPVVAVVYSHSHADHFGGVRGVVDEADVSSGKVKIIAPVGFMHHAVSENVYAGNAMTRRMFFQYGVLLPRSPFGHVDQSIGKNTAAGNLGLIAPTVIIEKDIEELTVDGVKMVFQNTPGTEAPAEMNTWFPDMKAFWAAENITGTIHNIYTLRGALVRDALEWSKQINKALYLFGQEAEVMFASHSWPRWGNDRIQEVMRAQRDAYAHLNNQVLHLANQGVTINEIHNVYELPEEPAETVGGPQLSRLGGAQQPRGDQPLPGLLGCQPGDPDSAVACGFRAAVCRDDGWREQDHRQGQGTLRPGQVPPCAGDPQQAGVRRAARTRRPRTCWPTSSSRSATSRRAPACATASWRRPMNCATAFPSGASPKTAGPDMIRAMTTELWLDFLGIRLDSKKAEGKHFNINLVTPDNGEKFVVELSNATLDQHRGLPGEEADLTITINRADLEQIMMGGPPSTTRSRRARRSSKADGADSTCCAVRWSASPRTSRYCPHGGKRLAQPTRDRSKSVPPRSYHDQLTSCASEANNRLQRTALDAPPLTGSSAWSDPKLTPPIIAVGNSEGIGTCWNIPTIKTRQPPIFK